MVSIEQIIERLGGVAAAARRLSISHPSLIKWKKTGRVPAARLMQVADLTGFDPADIRPDLAEQAKLFAASGQRSEATEAA